MTARKILKQTPLLVRRGPFLLGKWAPSQASALYQGLLLSHAAFSMVMVDEKESTGLVTDRVLLDVPPPREAEKGWSVITLDAPMTWDVVGVLAEVSAAIAASGIPLAAVCAFSRDHFLVKFDRLDEALAALKPLCGPVTHVD